jgi:hypothetical protein
MLPRMSISAPFQVCLLLLLLPKAENRTWPVRITYSKLYSLSQGPFRIPLYPGGADLYVLLSTYPLQCMFYTWKKLLSAGRIHQVDHLLYFTAYAIVFVYPVIPPSTQGTHVDSKECVYYLLQMLPGSRVLRRVETGFG